MSALIKRKTVAEAEFSGDFLVDCQRLAAAKRRRSGQPPSAEDITKDLLDQALAEAARLVAEARRDADEVRAAARKEGRDEAAAELAVAKSEMALRLEQLESEAAAQVAQFWRDVEPELLKLSVDIARKVVRREVEQNSEFILEAIKAGLHQLTDRRKLQIRVNAAQSGLVRERKDELVAGFDGISSVEVIEDRRISEGGWIVESANGGVDGTIESQVKEIERVLMEACGDAKF